MAFFQIKDFGSGLAIKIRKVFVNTDENLPAHLIQDNAGNDILGNKDDAKTTATDTTSVSMMQVFKQISASVQSLVTAWGSALTRAAGAADSNTLRVTIDSTQAGSDPMLADDSGFIAATTKVLPMGFVADETATDSVNEDDIGAARMTLDRKQHVVNEVESNSMRISGIAVTPKFAVIQASTSGDANTLVAAVTSKKIRVLAYNFMANGTVNAKFSSDPAGTPAYITGLKYCVANTGLVAPYNPAGWFETASGKALGVNLSAAVAIGGELTYIEV